MKVKGRDLRKGDLVEFLDHGDREGSLQTKTYEGRYQRSWGGYLLVETGKSLWRVIPHNVTRINGAEAE